MTEPKHRGPYNEHLDRIRALAAQNKEQNMPDPLNNPLTGLLSPKARRYLYAALFLAGVVVACLNLADVDTGAAVDIIAYLGTAFGLVAASNTPSPERKD